MYYIHLFCLDPAKYGTTAELLLGPYEGIGVTWGFIRGYRKDTSPPEDYTVHVDKDVLRLAAKGREMSFYSDLEVVDEDTVRDSDYLRGLPAYVRPDQVPITGRPSYCDKET